MLYGTGFDKTLKAYISSINDTIFYMDLNETTMMMRGHAVVIVIFNYSRLSLSRIPRDSLKYFEIFVPRHIRFAEFGKNNSINHI